MSKPMTSGRRQGDTLEVAVGGEQVVTVTYQGLGICRLFGLGCRRPILWCETAKGKRLPVDPVPDAAGHYPSHWTTCQDQERIRARVKERRT